MLKCDLVAQTGCKYLDSALGRWDVLGRGWMLPTWTCAPAINMARRFVGRAGHEVTAAASRTWQLAPAATAMVPRAYFLPGQLERVTGHLFAPDNFRSAMYGGFRCQHSATMAYLIEDCWLVNGVLYKGNTATYLQKERSRFPAARVENDIRHGAMYCTLGGNEYFGQWLIEDCVTYRLAVQEGVPVTVVQSRSPHVIEYEECFGMNPCRVRATRLQRLIVFSDVGQNPNKRARFQALQASLAARISIAPHAGVFVLRGMTGQRRLLLNELELAEQLKQKRGFRIIDPMNSDVATIAAACAGAGVIVGIEGSHLVHALLTATPGSSLLVIQPPSRFGTVLKDIADRDEMKFGFVVGSPHGIHDDFHVHLEEVERTLDLMLDGDATD